MKHCKSYTQAIVIASCETAHLSGRGHGFVSQRYVQNVLGIKPTKFLATYIT